MKDASALFRLLGDEARLRLLRVLARDRFNVTELTGILGPGAVRRVAASGAAQGRRAGQRGARRRLQLLPAGARRPGATATGPLWPLLEAQFAARGRRRRGQGR